MKAYCINLKRRTDRLAEVKRECKKNMLDMVLIEAVDGKEVYSHVEGNIMKGALGCYDSHLKALKLIKESGETGLIIEDDAVFIDNFRVEYKKRIDELPDKWDMFFLGGSMLWENPTEPYSENLLKAKNILCTQAYLVNIKSIDKLIKKVEEKQWKIDVIYTDFQQKNNCFISYPEIAWQRKGYSDLVDSITDNKHLRYGK